MYQAVYKCRLCGEKFGDCMTGEEIAEILDSRKRDEVKLSTA